MVNQPSRLGDYQRSGTAYEDKRLWRYRRYPLVTSFCRSYKYLGEVAFVNTAYDKRAIATIPTMAII